ncbi:MAG: hypothetical protein MR283_01215 [Erysipelotrichaceae bacterium]|nr:hypothetical protein [Erysipelotrichaceae bacterium]MDY6035786.1 hypothetical protein [Bulleidia sp.]
MKKLTKILIVVFSACMIALIFQYTHEPKAQQPVISENTDVDYDLTELSGNVVYSQVYSMMTNPQDYVDKTFKISGIFAIGKDQHGNSMFGCIIKDALGCCQQGIQFEWAGSHKYPDEYPELGKQITVTGTFTYKTEGNTIYLILQDAQLSQI